MVYTVYLEREILYTTDRVVYYYQQRQPAGAEQRATQYNHAQAGASGWKTTVYLKIH